MIPVIKNNIHAITEACKKMGVQSLHLFGSAAREDDFKETSDLDFLYRFQTNEHGMLVTPYDYFDLLFQLESITKRKVDLVAADKMQNKHFLQRVSKNQIKLYEA